MSYQRLKFRLTGVSPLVLHNGRLADPLNRIVKESKKVTGKKKKTDADHEEMARLEFLGSLYLHKGEPCIPGENIEGMLLEAARKLRRGNEIKAGAIADGNFPLQYDGPRAPDDLWEDEKFRLVAGVKVQRNRIIRTRPIFREWACDIAIDFLPDQLNREDISEVVRIGGRIVGIGDWRPKFGRFTAETL